MGIIAGADLSATYTAAQLEEGKCPKPGDCFFGAGNKVYKFVIYDTGAGSVAAVAGNVTYYHTLDGYKLHTVTSDLSDSVEIGAGVLQAAPGDGEYCWIQIKGAATLNTALTAGADGDPLTPTGATDGTLDVSGAVTDNVCAIAGDISDKEVICDFPW
jgi:hypothetical protein